MNDDILKEELMDMYRNPSKKGHLKDVSVEVSQKNPMCGDDVHLQLKIEDGKISDAAFDGSACSVSVISSEVLLDNITGKTLEEVKKITKDDLLKMVGLNLTTSRVACATLTLTALEHAIEKYDQEKN